MLVPSVAKRQMEETVRADGHPTMDYFALQQALGADLMDYTALEANASPALVRLARRRGETQHSPPMRIRVAGITT